MKVRTRTALGIDIGERRISVALVEKAAQGVRIVAAAREDLPLPEPGSGQSGFGRVLSDLLGQLGRRHIWRTKAAVAVSVDPLVMQLLDLPQPMPTNLGEFVTQELQQYVALSGRTVVSDFCGIGSGVQKRLLAVAADADKIETIVKACRATGIVVDSVEPVLLAYARAALEGQEGRGPGGEVLIAMLGARTLTTGLFRRGTLDFVRTRSLPADTHTPRLLCRWLADELRAVVRYYQTQVVPRPAEWRICVAVHEGVHRADEIAPQLAPETGGRMLTVMDVCAPWTDLDSPSESARKSGMGFQPMNHRRDADATASLAAVGAALTLLGTGAGGFQVNLIPPVVREARSRARHLLLTANAAVLIFLGIFVTSQLLTRTTGAMARRIEQTRISGELYATPSLIAEEEFLDQEIAGLQERVEPLRRVMEGREAGDWPAVLEAVRRAMPAEVSVLQWHGSGGRTLSVKGLAPSCPVAETFVRNLEGQSLFESVSLATLEKRRDSDHHLEYRIECLLKSKGGASL
jgi:Tfp pilus assembly protein PilN